MKILMSKCHYTYDFIEKCSINKCFLLWGCNKNHQFLNKGLESCEAATLLKHVGLKLRSKWKLLIYVC